MDSQAANGRRLHVGVWVDSTEGDKYVADLLAFLGSQPRLFQVSLLIAGTTAPSGGALRRALWRLIDWEERKFIRNHPLHRDHQAPRALAALAPVCVVRDGRGGEPATEARLAALGLDLLLLAGATPPPPGLLAAARLGALALAGEDGGQGGAPPGFWAAFHGRAKTGFTIMASGPAGAPPRLQQQGFYSTRRRFLLNQAELRYKAQAHLKDLLLASAAGGALPPARGGALAPPQRAPGPLDLLCYGAKLLWRKVVDKVRLQYLDSKEVWGISYMYGPWDRRPLPELITPAVPAGHFWADPFLLEHEGRTYCFLEDYDYARALGHISVLELRGRDCIELGPCLIEPFHLSFPYLFHYQGQLYMCPEASQSGQIRVYRSAEFPLRWELAAVLMDGVSAADSMLFEHGGRWWMLTNIDQSHSGDHCSELQLFYADSPLSSAWTAHPMNPLRIDAEGGRNGGLLREPGRLLRVGQRQGFGNYGEGALVYEITALDEQVYAERLVERIDAALLGRGAATHHLNSTGAVTVMDHKQWRYLTRSTT
jgi:hypothetical protein